MIRIFPHGFLLVVDETEGLQVAGPVGFYGAPVFWEVTEGDDVVYFHTGGAADDTLVVVALPDCFFEACWYVPYPPQFCVVTFVLGAAGAAWGCEF